MIEDVSDDPSSEESARARQSYWDLPPAKTDWGVWRKRATIALLVAIAALRLWPIVQGLNAEKTAAERLLDNVPIDDGAAPRDWLKITADGGGRKLVVTFIGRPELARNGRCVTTYTALVQEAASEVRVSIITSMAVGDGNGELLDCGSDVATRTIEVTLDEPLAARVVINGATGLAQPVENEV